MGYDNGISLLLFNIAQMPVAGIPDRNHCRLHQDNAKRKIPGIKEFRRIKIFDIKPYRKTSPAEQMSNFTRFWCG
jgi:hypothetical protein